MDDLRKPLCEFSILLQKKQSAKRSASRMAYLRKSWDLASIRSPLSLSSGCKGKPANRAATASILAWSKSLWKNTKYYKI